MFKSLIIALLLCSPILAGPPHWCVRILIDDKSDGCMDYGGTGSLVAQRYVITNWHVIETAINKKGTVYVRFPDWVHVEGEIVKYDKQRDLALIKVPIAYRNPCKLGESVSIGDTVTIMGYGQGLWESKEAKVVNTAFRKGIPKDSFIECTGFQATQGSSGGPILNEEKELVGVLWGSGGGTTMGIRIREVRKFIEEYVK